uniref:uncharacterized protein LOC120346603 n=1 Tax=Styela clava TaxID=7725 RepID=UPI001939E3B1|nr:uncharacterized protein LOC120346603 [Styela clava]
MLCLTLIDYAVFCSIGGKECDLSPCDVCFQPANGTSLKARGMIDLKICIDSVCAVQRVIIADLGAPYGLLGMDYFQEHDCVLHMSVGQMEVDGKTVSLTKPVSSVPSCRIVVDKCVTVPRESEMVIYGRLNCPWKPNSDVIAVAEAACVFESEYGHRGLFLFPGVVDASCSLVPLMVVNVSKEAVEIPADLTVSSLEQVVPGDVMDTRELPEHLKKLVDDPEDLTVEQRQSVRDLLVEFQDIFAGPDGKLGRTSVVKHKIKTSTPEPIKVPPRRMGWRMGWAKRGIAEKQVQSMLDQGVIEPSESPYNSPIVLVPKKDGSCRFCIDFRKINLVTIKDAYSLPRIDDILDALGKAKWFSSLDLASGYWQVELDPEDREKTAFSLPGNNHFQFRVLAFGLANAPSCFQRLIDKVLAGIYGKLFAFDDILFMEKTLIWP